MRPLKALAVGAFVLALAAPAFAGNSAPLSTIELAEQGARTQLYWNPQPLETARDIALRNAAITPWPKTLTYRARAAHLDEIMRQVSAGTATQIEIERAMSALHS
jgi:hypothetical protein